MSGRLYTIKETAMKTGVSTQLIRKWEERYGAVSPTRFPNGYRGYTKEDIQAIHWLKKQVDRSVPIGMAVQELELLRQRGELEALAGLELQDEWSATGALAGSSLEGAMGAHAVTGSSGQRDRLIECLLQLDAAGARRIFDELMAVHSFDYVLLQIVEPVMIEIGLRWERKEISEFQEHFGSHFIRERLLAIKNFFHTTESTQTLVTACTPLERHELGILVVGLFAQQQGFQVVHLGISPSERGIFDCLRSLKPAAFAFGASSRKLLEESQAFFLKLDQAIEECSPKTKVFIGGRVVAEDGLLPGTKHVHYVAGSGIEAVRKLKHKLEEA